MKIGKNLVFLRKMRNQMTQEELAEIMGVSRQTVSKWELEESYPEICKIIELCKIFSCSMDELVQMDMDVCEDAFSNIRVEEVKEFEYLKYAVVSMEPEEDAINHVRGWAKMLEIKEPQIVGWDFSVVSQEQLNIHHMHGYAAALVLPKGVTELGDSQLEIVHQKTQDYVAITITNPFRAPFHLIPNAYKTLMAHIQVNQLSSSEPEGVISCFEKEYVIEGMDYMDVYIAINRK